MDEQFLKTPWYGSRQMMRQLRREGLVVNRKRVRRLMRLMGIEAVAPKPGTSRSAPAPIFPYLLRNLSIEWANQVWCADITYLPMAHGFLYLVAIMDWYSRRVLAWGGQHPGGRLLCRGARRGPRSLRVPRDLQHRSGQPVHRRRMDRGAQGPRYPHFHGRQRPLDGQCIHRAVVALTEIRMHLSQCLRHTPRGAPGHRSLDAYYNDERPHSSLDGYTPREIHAGRALRMAA